MANDVLGDNTIPSEKDLNSRGKLYVCVQLLKGGMMFPTCFSPGHDIFCNVS